MKKGFCALAVLSIVAAAAFAYPQPAGSSSASQGEAPGVRAVAILAPPAVMEQNGALTGFAIELWNAIAAQLNLKTSYQLMPDVGALEEALRSNSADVVISPPYITSARDEVFDFSFPVMDSGLQIMVLDTGQKAQTASPLWDMLRLMFSRTTVLWLGMALLLVLIRLIWSGGSNGDSKPARFQAETTSRASSKQFIGPYRHSHHRHRICRISGWRARSRSSGCLPG